MSGEKPGTSQEDSNIPDFSLNTMVVHVQPNDAPQETIIISSPKPEVKKVNTLKTSAKMETIPTSSVPVTQPRYGGITKSMAKTIQPKQDSTPQASEEDGKSNETSSPKSTEESVLSSVGGVKSPAQTIQPKQKTISQALEESRQSDIPKSPEETVQSYVGGVHNYAEQTFTPRQETIPSEETRQPNQGSIPKSPAHMQQKPGNVPKSLANTAHPKLMAIPKTSEETRESTVSVLPKFPAPTILLKHRTIPKSSENTSQSTEGVLPKFPAQTIQLKHRTIPNSSEDTSQSTQGVLPKFPAQTIPLKHRTIPNSSEDTSQSTQGVLPKFPAQTIPLKHRTIPKSSEYTSQSTQDVLPKFPAQTIQLKHRTIPNSSLETGQLNEDNIPKSSTYTQFKPGDIFKSLSLNQGKKLTSLEQIELIRRDDILKSQAYIKLKSLVKNIQHNPGAVLESLEDNDESTTTTIPEYSFHIRKPLEKAIIPKNRAALRSSEETNQLHEDIPKSSEDTKKKDYVPTCVYEDIQTKEGNIIKVPEESLQPGQSILERFQEEMEEYPKDDLVNMIMNYEEFINMLKEADEKLVVVDFSACWCSPCRIIRPFYHFLSLKYEDVMFLEVDADDCEEVTKECSVSCLPTFQFYKKQEKVYEFYGAQKEKLEATIIELK
ncbi:thioredoxin domain-containing protein 2 [Thomomys bottae]